nr:copia protein [Tanacetum cinerariifolium]
EILRKFRLTDGKSASTLIDTDKPLLKDPDSEEVFPLLVKNIPPVNRKFFTGSKNFPTGNRKFPTASRKFPTGSMKFSTADIGMKGKAINPLACWVWKPSHDLSNKGPNNNSVSVMFKKYTYIDTQGRLKVEAMKEELLQFKIQKVWTLVDCPKGVRPIGTKWVLKNKKDERGIVIKNKARLVAQGHTQEERIDYDEVFAPVARIKAIRLFLAYASFMGFTVYQMDVKSAFLYGIIDEEVYVMRPPRF